jgi:hypothetical protein
MQTSSTRTILPPVTEIGRSSRCGLRRGFRLSSVFGAFGALTAACLLALFGASAQPRNRTGVEAPPRPRVVSEGFRHAVRGSFCWPQSNGSNVCVTGEDPEGPRSNRRALAVDPGGRVRINVFAHATDIAVTTLDGAPSPYGRTRPLDATGQVWTWRVPGWARRVRDVILGIDYRNGGDAVFGVRVRPDLDG